MSKAQFFGYPALMASEDNFFRERNWDLARCDISNPQTFKFNAFPDKKVGFVQNCFSQKYCEASSSRHICKLCFLLVIYKIDSNHSKSRILFSIPN